MQKPTILIICGPTAVGKTAVAVDLAGRLGTDIISADSRQCFRELSIGVAKPNGEQLSKVKHYFINSHSILEEVNAGVFEAYALKAAGEIFSKSPVAIVVGGTGLYIKALVDGMDVMPTISPEIRQEVVGIYQQFGLEHLQSMVAERDPLFWHQAERENPQRLMRALEIVLATGRSVTDFRKGTQKERPFDTIEIGLQLPREQLYKHINHRVDQMVEDGLVDEAFSLLPYRLKNALQTVGYRELFEYFDQKVSLAAAIDNIKLNTRHYAKRQLTWFKKSEHISWFDANDPNLIESLLKQLPGRQ